jgi:hypothetical protein
MEAETTAWKVLMEIQNHRYLDFYLDSLTRVESMLQQSIDAILTSSETIDKLLRATELYADKAFNEIKPHLNEPHNLVTSKMYSREPVFPQPPSSSSTSTPAAVRTKMINAKITSIMLKLANLRLSDTIVKFFFDDSLAFSAIRIAPKTGMPFYFRLLTDDLITDWKDQVFDSRYPDGLDETGDDDVEEDDLFELYEKRFVDSHLNEILASGKPTVAPKHVPGVHKSKKDIEHDSSKTNTGSAHGSRTDHSDRSPGRTGGSSHNGSGSGTPKADKKEGTTTGDPSSSKSRNTGDDGLGPDDSAYTPDPYLSYKVRKQIALVQSGTDKFEKRDHMTRFHASNEAARSLPRSQVQMRDIIAIAGRTSIDQGYVVTFTRRHKKPIFNPISGN